MIIGHQNFDVKYNVWVCCVFLKHVQVTKDKKQGCK